MPPPKIIAQTTQRTQDEIAGAGHQIARHQENVTLTLPGVMGCLETERYGQRQWTKKHLGIAPVSQISQASELAPLHTFHGLVTHESMANGIGTATTGSPDWAGRAAKPQRIGGWGTEQHVVGTAMRASEFVWAR